MEDEEIDFKAKIFFNFREKYYNNMINLCKEAVPKFKNDSHFRLYHAMGLLLNNRLEECINQLDSLKQEADVKLSSVIALMYAHKMLGVSNKEIFQRLDAQMRDLRKSADSIDFYHSAFVLFALNKLEKALDYVEKALNMTPEMPEALSLKAWLLIYLRKFGANTTALFEGAVKSNKRNLDPSLGLAESYLSQNKIEEALTAVNKAIVRFPNSELPLIQKMKIQLASQDWEQTIETMNRIVNANLACLDALKTNILILLCRDGNYGEAVTCIKKFVKEIEAQEQKNARIFLECAQLFSKICARHQGILQETCKMAEKAVQIHSEDAEAIVELANQHFLLGHIREAQQFYKMASKIDESSFQALLGLTYCEMAENKPIKAQIDYLLELEEAQNSAQLYLVRAKISESSEEAFIFLKKACDLQLGRVRHLYFSEAYLQAFNIDLMLQIVKEYLKVGKNSNVVQNVLKLITKACPGLFEASYLLGKLQFMGGESTNAMQSLERILSKIDDEGSSDAHLLMAQIQVQHGYYDRAAQSLEVGLSNNFKVRENPLYHYIQGLVDKNTNNVQDAVKSLTTALTLMDASELSLSEKASIYIELIEVHNLLGQVEEAAKLLDVALEEFQGTPEESRILILSAEHAVVRKNVQGAIELLNKVKPKEAYYLQARTKLAEILLEHRLDKYAYLECYQEMVDQNPSSESYLLLGDAYMTILEPDDALECYNLALQQNPQDPILTSKLGKALVETHYFAKAISFYKESIKATDNSDLKLQLADLYLQMKEYEKAELLLMNELESENAKNFDDLIYLQYKTKLLILLAQTREKRGNITAALSTLKDARDNQNRVRKRLAVEQTNVPDDEIKLLVDIGVKLAEIASSLKNNDQAIQFYKDVLEISANNTTILTALSKLYLQINILEPCQQICTNILAIEPENENASVMLADIAFRKIDFDMALFHFTQLITKQPTNWTALVRLVEIMRRTGNLNEVPEYLTKAEQTASKDPGFFYCTALYQWYGGNLNGALRNFNLARQDPDWGQQAICNMIEICLNPDDEMISEQFMDSDDIEYRDSRSMALKTADRLLKELKHRLDASGEDILKHKLLQNFRLLATQEKVNVERSLEEFIAIASQNPYKEHVGPILGMATAYTILKQTQRAKNQLKRVAKATWTFEDAEYLERCWLLLADYYIQSAKFDVASDLLNKVVQHNKACSKAYEFLGFICEKEQHYKDAVTNYENAWKFGGKSNPGIGFKLAYSLMKSKNYADAVDIGQQVLKLNPDYPKVKKDILDKCMNNLRI